MSIYQHILPYNKPKTMEFPLVFWFFLFFIVFKPTSTYSQNWSSDFGNMFLSVSPRILENGSITDISLAVCRT